ncbi:MAG TPA: AI-2E family transporter [Nocardioidaceae bacterium]|nr:AI-2E family transporter [Nocardioidaceae bacterium]
MAPEDAVARPARLPRGLIILGTLAAAAITIGGLRSTSGILGPIFLALVLTILVHPVRTMVLARGAPAWLGTVTAMVTVYLLLLGLGAALVVAVGRFATLVPTYADDFDGLLDDIRTGLSNAGVGSDQSKQLTDSVDLNQLAGYLTNLLGNFFDALSSLSFALALLFFMALEASMFTDRMRRALDDGGALAASLQSFAQGTRTYLVVSTVFGLIVAVIDTLFLWLIDIPAPLLWGLLAFVTNYIPNIGFVIGLVPPALLALFEGGVSRMLIVIAVYSVINFVIQSIIQPKYVGDAVGLSGTITMISLVFWGWVFGALGALLAVPLTLLAKALLVDIDPPVRWTRTPTPAPEPPPEQDPAAESEPPATPKHLAGSEPAAD